MTQTDNHSQRTGSLYGLFAFGTIVLACFAGYFYTRNFYQPEMMVPVTFALGAVYLALGNLSNQFVCGQRRGVIAAYYLVQCALLTAMVFLSPVRGFFGLIVLPVASQSIFNLRPRWAALVCGFLFLVTIGVWGLDLGRNAAAQAALNYSAAFAFTIAFTLITKQALVAREREEKLRCEIEEAHEKLKAYSAQAEDFATTRERNRVAREIHDGLGHYLTVVKTQLDAAAALIASRPDDARVSVLKAAKLTGDALDDVRRSVGALRTDAARLPLPEALRALAVEADLPVALRLEGSARPLPPGIEHALFRSAQEGLTNVRKHAAAAATELRLDFRAPDRVTLAITDHGHGTNGAYSDGFGLRGLRERIELLGGRVESGNRPGGGFVLTIEVPA